MNEPPSDSGKFTDEAREGWDAVASGWKKWAPTLEAGAARVNDRLVDLAGVATGDRVLDIATGYGEPLVTAVDRIGPTGHAVATDLSPRMIRLARERLDEAGMSNVDFHTCNGETLEIPDADFDAALCRWGLMLMADPDACLRRVHELLKPGGRAAMAVFSEPANSPWLTIAGSTVRHELGLGPPDPDEPNIFRLADAGDLQQRFRLAGFDEIALERVAGEHVYDSPAAHVRFLQDAARDIVRLLEDEPSDRQQAIWQAVADAAHPYRGQDGRVHLGFECHCIAGRKPA